MKNQLNWFHSLPLGLTIRLVFLYFVRKVFRIPVNFSFSQGGEDIILGYLGVSEQGTYVDVGCNDPVRFSNTFQLYLRGWRGINIDANSELIGKCKRIRKKDVSICSAVSDSVREVTFYHAKGTLMSTIDQSKIEEWGNLWMFKESVRETVVTQTLTTILDKNLPAGTNVDLLTVDVEGHDLNVLKGLDFSKYKPRLIIVEIHDLERISDSDVYLFLTENGYSLEYYAVLNGYFVRNDA